MTLELPRRKFLTAAAALFCAPAIVRASSLMPVRTAKESSSIVPIFYSNRTIRVYMDIQQIRDRNVLLSIDDYAGEPFYKRLDTPERAWFSLGGAS